MQKEIPKRKPEYAISIKVIGERRSDVPLKLHRHQFPSFGSGKIAGLTSGRVVRLYVLLYFSLSSFWLPFQVSAHQRQEKEYVFRIFRRKMPRMPQICEKRRKKTQKKEKKARLISLRISISGTLKGDAKRRPPVPLADKHKWHP